MLRVHLCYLYKIYLFLNYFGKNVKKIKNFFKKVLTSPCPYGIIAFVGCKSSLIRPLGQVVKTPPFHGGNMGSNPVGVIEIGKIR